MKGIIVISIQDYYLKQKKTESDWNDILQNSGLGREKIILHSASIEDIYVEKIIDLMCEQLMMNREEILINLGNFFITNTAVKYYKTILDEYNNFKDFIYNLNKIHSSMVSLIPDTNPPIFEIIKTGNELTVKYISDRNLIDYAYGAFIGAGKYYKAKIRVRKVNNKEVNIKCLS
jgi:hypothetical protein